MDIDKATSSPLYAFLLREAGLGETWLNICMWWAVVTITVQWFDFLWTKHIFLGESGIALTFLNLLGVRGPSLLYVEASSFAKTQKVLGYVDKELGHGPSG